MGQIFKNLVDPSWWFTGVFFVLVGLVIMKLLADWIPNLWGRSSKYFPKKLRKLNRWNQRRVLLTVKKYRQRDMRVVWLIGRYWSLALIALIGTTLFFVYFALSKDITIQDVYLSSKYIILIPFYGLLAYTAIHKKTVVKIIDAHHKWKNLPKKSTN